MKRVISHMYVKFLLICSPLKGEIRIFRKVLLTFWLTQPDFSLFFFSTKLTLRCIGFASFKRILIFRFVGLFPTFVSFSFFLTWLDVFCLDYYLEFNKLIGFFLSWSWLFMAFLLSTSGLTCDFVYCKR